MKDKKLKSGVGTSLSVQAVKVPGPQSNAKQLVVRRLNWKDKKKLTERQAAKNFCNFTERQSWKLEPREEDDPVDITARSPGGTKSEDFQIVRLWETEDWQKLNTKGKGAVDRCYSDAAAVALFRKVLESKGFKKYPTDVQKKLTLLIDANPVASALAFVDSIKDSIAPLAHQVAYQAVWVVGTADAYKFD